MTVDVNRFQTAASHFTAFFNELGTAYVEREDVLAQIALALLAREHVLMTGPPGTAKSQIATYVLGRIIDEKTGRPSVYSRQFTESTVQTDLVGPINFKTLMDTGRTEHFTDEGILGAVHAFLDEVFDGRDMLLRSALNVLNERELKEGTKTTRGQIECAIMTSNRYLAEVLEGSRESLLAFVDRIGFVSFVPKGFADPANLGLVLRRQVGGALAPPLSAHLTIQDLDALQAAAESVVVPGAVSDALVSLLHMLEEDLAAAVRADPNFVATRYLSVRTAVRAGRILRAICVYDKVFRDPERMLEATQGDLLGLRLQLLLAGPSPDAVDRLLARETDPRERRQLGIVRTEREIFDRCLAKLPPVTHASTPSIDVAGLVRATEAAVLAGDATKIGAATRALADAAAGHSNGAERAAEALRDTVGKIASQALRAGLTGGSDGRGTIGDVVSDLAKLAHRVERVSPQGHPLARWVRGRAVQALDDAAALLPSLAHAAAPAVIADRVDVHDFATRAEDRIALFENLATKRERLLAHGADLDVGEDEMQWARAIERLVDDVAAVWQPAFRTAVQNVLVDTPPDQLAAVLERLGPTFDRIDKTARRLEDLGARNAALKARVVAPRVSPIVRSGLERIDARDRRAVLETLGGLLDRLRAAGLENVLAPKQLLAWTALALLRCEPPLPKDSNGAGIDGYRELRSSEARMPIVYTLVETALRVAPELGRDPSRPLESVAGVRELLATLEDATRQAIVAADLDRLERQMTYLERWWSWIRQDPQRNALDALRDASASGLLQVVGDESALLRTGLDARLIEEVMPTAAERAALVRRRAEALDRDVSATLAAWMSSHVDGAWSDAAHASKRS